MEEKKRIKKIVAYETTDGKIFSGPKGLDLANSNQEKIDPTDSLPRFNYFIKKLFNIENEEDQDVFYDKIQKETSIQMTGWNFKEKISLPILDMFIFFFYSVLVVMDDTITPTFFYVMAVIYIKYSQIDQKNKVKVNTSQRNYEE